LGEVGKKVLHDGKKEVGEKVLHDWKKVVGSSLFGGKLGKRD